MAGLLNFKIPPAPFGGGGSGKGKKTKTKKQVRRTTKRRRQH